jgi:primosomal protein N' (replication factor Y) (superfamily II helicase)
LKEFAEILVDHKIYTYAIPAEWQEQLAVGQTVVITLRNKEKEGYVIRFVPQPDFKTKPLVGISDTIMHFDQAMVELAYWIADYYKCYPETALKAILPK